MAAPTTHTQDVLVKGLKRLLLEKVRTKRVSISLPAGDSLAPTPTPAVPALSQAAVDEYGLTMFTEEPSASTSTAATSSAPPVFLADDRLLRDLRRHFLNNTIWKLCLVSKPKKSTVVLEGWLKKKSSSSRLIGAWQRRFFRLTTKQLAYWNTAENAAAAQTDLAKNPPKGVFPVSAFHEAITVASKQAVATPPQPALTTAEPPPPEPPAAASPRTRIARQASILNTNLDSTRVRLGPWGSFSFILEFPGRSLELQANGKPEFQRWLNAFFGREYLSNLVVSHEEQMTAPAPPPRSAANGPQLSKNSADDTVASSSLSAASSSPVFAALNPSPMFGAIPIESRMQDSRDTSLSARDVLKGDAGLFGSYNPYDAAPGREDIDSENSMSENWPEQVREDSDNWAMQALAAANGGDSYRAGSVPLEDGDRRGSRSGLNSFMPSASATPASSVTRPDDDENPVEHVLFAADPSPAEDSDDDDAPPPATAPFPMALSPVAVPAPVEVIAPSPTPSPIPFGSIPIEEPEPLEATPIESDEPEPVLPVMTRAPSASFSGGMFAGGFGTSGAASVGAGSLMGSMSIANAALEHSGPPSSHSRRNSFSGLSPLASLSRRPSMDLSSPIQPPSGTELNFSPTLQRRLSHSGPLPMFPPLPDEPAPIPSEQEIAAAQLRLALAAEAERAQTAAAEEQRRADEEQRRSDAAASAAQAEIDRRVKAQAHEQNVSQIRRYLEQEAAVETAAKATAPVPPPFPGLSSSPSSFPASPLDSSSSVASAEYDPDLLAQQARDLEEFRATIIAKPQHQLVDLATKQAEEIAELKRQLRILAAKQGQQSSDLATLHAALAAERALRLDLEEQLHIKTTVNQRIVARLMEVENVVASLSQQLLVLAQTEERATPAAVTRDEVKRGRTRDRPSHTSQSKPEVAGAGIASATSRARSKSPATASAASAAHVARLANSRPRTAASTTTSTAAPSAASSRGPSRSHSRRQSVSAPTAPGVLTTSAAAVWLSSQQSHIATSSDGTTSTRVKRAAPADGTHIGARARSQARAAAAAAAVAASSALPSRSKTPDSKRSAHEPPSYLRPTQQTKLKATSASTTPELTATKPKSRSTKK